MSDEQLIRHCSPTLASLKTGNLVACHYKTRDAMIKNIRSYNLRLGRKGLRFLPLRYENGKALVYVYRPEKLEADLRSKPAGALLHACGYQCKNATHCLRHLMERLEDSGNAFPHEIGLFLSYPPADVYGFIRHRDKARLSGVWKVYCNVEEAQKTFARYKKCTDSYLRLWQDGRSLDRLAVKS